MFGERAPALREEGGVVPPQSKAARGHAAGRGPYHARR
jgi:hypothetical protein